jgi:hypothetical protein
MLEAWNNGVNYFDTAEVYASGECEKAFGQVLRDLKFKRSDLVVSTKLFWGGAGPNDTGLSKKHLFEGMNASLDRLGLDYVDIVMAHRPDPLTPSVGDKIRRTVGKFAEGNTIHLSTKHTTIYHHNADLIVFSGHFITCLQRLGISSIRFRISSTRMHRQMLSRISCNSKIVSHSAIST